MVPAISPEQILISEVFWFLKRNWLNSEGISGMEHFPPPFICSLAAGLALPCKWENFVVNINSAFADLCQKLQPVCG